MKDLRSEKSDVEIEKLMMIASKKEDTNFMRGDAVIARHDQLGYYFTGKITKVIDSRHANVKFENGVKQEKMSMRNIVKAGRNHQLIAVIELLHIFIVVIGKIEFLSSR